jgi:hypothetical protein
MLIDRKSYLLRELSVRRLFLEISIVKDKIQRYPIREYLSSRAKIEG